MSNYPSRTDIVTAMRNPQLSFKAKQLIGGSVIRKGTRIIQYSGGYTTVFPFNTKNKNKIALRLWIADIGDAKRRSLEISKYLKSLKSHYFVDFKYIDDAILINGHYHPVVLMEWVEGDTLKEYIQNNIGNSTRLYNLAEKFKDMIAYFHSQNIAHGDLQHGNILIKSNEDLVVIDYDSMYIKPLKGMRDIVKGIPGYQHPARKKNKNLNSKLDYFSELIIYLSLIVFAKEPYLWKDCYKTEHLLFSEKDLSEPGNSALIKKLKSSNEQPISKLTSKLIEELKKKDITQLRPLEELLFDKLKKTKREISDKWDNQPNPPKRKPTSFPTKKKITDKF